MTEIAWHVEKCEKKINELLDELGKLLDGGALVSSAKVKKVQKELDEVEAEQEAWKGMLSGKTQ